MIPDRETCLRILKSKNPENIVNHTLAVTKIAMQIGEAYKKAGYDINLKLLEAGALLHDVCKWDEIQTKSKIHHAYIGADFLKDKFPELSEIVRKHPVYEYKNSDFHTWTIEEKIVNYADKRVTHDKLVSLKDRYSDLRVRYPDHRDDLDQTEATCEELEKDIFSKINLKLEDIV